MKFTTEVKVESKDSFFKLNQKILTIGSCFSENIGVRLTNDGFDTSVNPFGILFHPGIIAKNISACMEGDYRDGDSLERDNKWFHYDYHSKITADSKEGLTRQIKGIQSKVRHELLNNDRLILTFGTAWGFKRIVNDTLVGNCHKISQKEFIKELANLEELKKCYFSLFEKLKKQNKELSIVLTVSPVRHIKNGHQGNNISKSILILLSHYLSETFDFVHYFPSYEIVMDELRDYRFFNSDLIHPTDLAVDYVYEKFEKAYVDERNTEIIKLQRKLNQLNRHRAIHESDDGLINEKKARLSEDIKRLKIKL